VSFIFLAAFIRSYDRFAERYERLLDRVLDDELPRYAEALERLGQ